ncbi:phosphoglycerate mutase [Meridianimarinicoccus roseus]|uniref:Phosphoglycerate mutase n=1 Tax=Meridianimarinicoccus roseus TaxID=2072018 RepID=A0A2V2L9W8_9RHOB|nr:histidine phosphatase family protein [Meridianimarinicoccus roseus]PWR02012.1 phosphoglycerate mutase [Meridianimarinicoccus roseus]
MSRRLILMRHAKSDWSDSDASDHARLLNRRGQDACVVIGSWLAARGYEPQQVLVSDAARTRETWARLAPELHNPVDPEPDHALYLALPGTMLGALQKATAPVVAMIGHNPGIGTLAAGLVTHRPEHPRFGAYPTLATMVADFPIDDWSELQPRSGTVVDFIVPRDLTD